MIRPHASLCMPMLSGRWRGLRRILRSWFRVPGAQSRRLLPAWPGQMGWGVRAEPIPVPVRNRRAR